MKDNKAWLKHFSISQEHSSCTLKEVLKKELIQQGDYKRWASYYYNMPILNVQYFKDYPQLNKNLWKKYTEIWNDSTLPVLEWDNIVYVASLEPSKVQIDKKVVFLLTHTKCLEHLWKQTLSQSQPSQENLSHPKNKKNETYRKESISSEEDIIIDSNFLQSLWTLFLEKVAFISQFLSSNNFQFLKSNKSSHHNHIENKWNKMNQKIQNAHGSPPEVAQKENTVPSEKKEIVSVAPPTQNPPPEESTIALARDNENQKPSHHKEETSTPEEGTIALARDNENQKSSHHKEETSTPEESTIALALDNENQKSSHHKEETSTPEEGTIALALDNEDQKSSNKEKTSTPENPLLKEKTAHSEKEIPLPVESPTPLAVKESKINKTPPMSILRQQLEETRKHINSYILFLFKKGQFIPYKWSSDLDPKKKVLGTTKNPSIFRICYTSKMPYCGKMAPVINNNYFFEKWGFETLPVYVVMIPFLNENKKIMGGYLGISKEHIYSTNFLNFIEKLVKPFSTFYNEPRLLKKIA